jgi:uncharacterized DUF497 family protein
VAWGTVDRRWISRTGGALSIIRIGKCSNPVDHKIAYPPDSNHDVRQQQLVYFCTYKKIASAEYLLYVQYMKITYDEMKRLTNIEKHGLDFADLTIEFFAGSIVLPAKEDRFLAVGEFQGRIIAAVVFRPLGSQALSVISMRPASAKERRL